MPAGDGTGPKGEGPLTGRGLGSCVGPRKAVWGLGRGGRPRGLGRGRGRGPWFKRNGLGRMGK